MSIIASREAVEEFVRDDPFRLNGVIRRSRILEWNETPIAAAAYAEPHALSSVRLRRRHGEPWRSLNVHEAARLEHRR
jgi:hypothetical protein